MWLECVLDTHLRSPARVDVGVIPRRAAVVREAVDWTTRSSVGDRDGGNVVVLDVWAHTPATIQQVAEVDDVGIELERVTRPPMLRKKS